MEYYESRCTVCRHSWQWVGYKTALGKTPEQIEAMKAAGTKCPRCGGEAKVGLDHESSQARAFDGALKDVASSVAAPKEEEALSVLAQWEKTRKSKYDKPPRVRVETIKPDDVIEHNKNIWPPEAGSPTRRKWGVSGRVLGIHEPNGLSQPTRYDVQHDDGTFGSYELRELRVIEEEGVPLSNVIGDILAPVADDEPSADVSPSPKVTFRIGDEVLIHKFGWAGRDRVAEVRGEHVRVESKMRMFGKDQAVWFHYTELRPAASVTL